MVDWPLVPFEQVLSEPVRNGIYKQKEFHGRGCKIVNMGELFGHPRLRAIPMKRVELTASERQRFMLATDDLIFARRSLTAEGAGKCSIVLELDDDTTFESSIIRARPDPTKVSSLFLYYFFNSPIGFHRLDTIRRQVAVAGITGSDLSRLEIPVPSVKEQQAIAAVVGALDDKIDLNRRTNETLEAMARAIFKDWFVDFRPTRTKMDGGAPYLAPELWALFPNLLDDDEKPQGWTSSTIGQEVDVVGGSTPSTKEPAYWNGDIAWATPKDLSSLRSPVLLTTERQITDLGLSQISSGLLPMGTVLLSSRAPIGYLAIAQVPTAINQGFIAMVCRKHLSNVFVWLWTQANMDTVLQNANGSTFQEISKTNFRPITVTVAGHQTLRAFDETVKPLFERIVANEKEINSLATIRDFLLPKLMSGEIRVKDARKIAEAAL
jgi:type I restriction enzyme S subunit